MSTGLKKTNIYLKKFLTQQQITENFLDYLHDLILEDHIALVGVGGTYTHPITAYSPSADKMNILTPGESVPGDLNGPIAKMDDGNGHIMSLTTAQRTNIAVPNELGVEYHVGARFNWQPNGTEINVRTGVIQWSLEEEAVGELGYPNAVAYHGNTLTLQVDNICSDVDQFGRYVKVYLNIPKSQSTGDVFEEVEVIPHSIQLEKNGGLGFIDVPNGIVQFFIPGKSYTIDKTPSSPTVFIVTTVGVANSGGTGYTRINVNLDLSAYTVVAGSYILTGYNIVNLSGTLGQGLSPSLTPTDYAIFMSGVTVTTNNLAADDRYVYLFSYIGTGSGNLPGPYNWVNQEQIPENVMGSILDLEKWHEYAKQRNAFILRGGGQFTFLGGELSWNADFYIVNPFRGDYKIPADSISGIIDNDVLYVKIRKEQDVVASGNSSGEIWIKDNSQIEIDDTVLIGDVDSARVSGVVKGKSGAEYLYIEDGLGSPLDMSTYTATTGSWVQPTNIEILKEQINTGELRPTATRYINEDIQIIAMAHTNSLIFKNGVMVLEDGDTGEIGNLPSGVNWVSNITELRNSVTLTSDDNVALISPKEYEFSTDLSIDKNLTWCGLSDRVVLGLNAGIDIEVAWDTSTVGLQQNVEFRRLRFVGAGAGGTITIDNAGATKPIVVNFLDCVFTNITINVVKTETAIPVIINIEGCRGLESRLAINFPVSNVNDSLNIKGFKFSSNVADIITFGDAATNPGAKASIEDTTGLSSFVALSSGRLNTVTLASCKGTLANNRIQIVNPEQALIEDLSTDVNLFDESQFLKNRDLVNIVGGGLMTYSGGTLYFTEAFKVIDPVHGITQLAGGSLAGISDGSILYLKFYRPKRFWKDGTALGVAYISDTSNFNDDDEVIVGNDTTRVSGYVNGAPTLDNSLIVDDGLGTPIDLSTYLISTSAWIKRVNSELLVGTLGIGDLARDVNGKISEDIFIFGIADAKGITLTNGFRIEPWWVYEEDMISAGYSDGDTITLPVDSKNSSAVKKYKNNIGHLAVYENGEKLSSDPVNVSGGTFDPDSYDTLTGFVAVPDGTDLSAILREDIFVDAASSEHQILGGINTTIGSKGFKIATGAVVDLGAGAYVMRKQYDEDGSLNTWQNTITSRKTIPAGAILKFKIFPLGNAGRSVDA